MPRLNGQAADSASTVSISWVLLRMLASFGGLRVLGEPGDIAIR